MNKPKLILDLTSLSVALAGGVLALADKIVAIHGLPGWVVNAWPVVLLGATFVDRLGNIVLNFLKSQNNPPATTP